MALLLAVVIVSRMIGAFVDRKVKLKSTDTAVLFSMTHPQMLTCSFLTWVEYHCSTSWWVSWTSSPSCSSCLGKPELKRVFRLSLT